MKKIARSIYKRNTVRRGIYHQALLRKALALGVAALGLFLILTTSPEIAHASAQQAAKVTSNTFGNSKGVAFVFWIFAFTSLGGALFVITRRNIVTAVMGMVGTFFAIAGLYLMLYASFLAVMQVLVYAGAIMVLFVFVIMILNRPEDEPWAVNGILGKGIAALSLLYLFKRLAEILWHYKDTHTLVLAKEQLHIAMPRAIATARDIAPNEAFYDFGTIKGVGYTLFTDYLFPFEAVSIVLLVAVVGALAIARPLQAQESLECDGDGFESQASKEAS